MTSVVLTYKGIPSKRQDAESRLRRNVGAAQLVRRTSDLFEAQVDERVLSIIACDPDWQLSLPTFVEIRKPSPKWAKIRDKLA